MKLIPLTRGKVALVDDSDFNYLSGFKWYATKPTRGLLYAARGVCRNRKTKIFLMHREIMGLHAGDVRQVDHKNRNSLDNRRSNLRIATKSQNGMNSKVQVNNSSGVRGVSLRQNKWDAYIYCNRKKIHLGRFHSRELASIARTQATDYYFRDFQSYHPKTNKP